MAQFPIAPTIEAWPEPEEFTSAPTETDVYIDRFTEYTDVYPEVITDANPTEPFVELYTDEFSNFYENAYRDEPQKEETVLKSESEVRDSQSEVTEIKDFQSEITVKKGIQPEVTEKKDSQSEITEKKNSQPKVTERKDSQSEVTEKDSRREVTENKNDDGQQRELDQSKGILLYNFYILYIYIYFLKSVASPQKGPGFNIHAGSAVWDLFVWNLHVLPVCMDFLWEL